MHIELYPVGYIVLRARERERERVNKRSSLEPIQQMQVYIRTENKADQFLRASMASNGERFIVSVCDQNKKFPIYIATCHIIYPY